MAVTPTRQPSAVMTRAQIADDVLDVMVNGLAGMVFQDSPADLRWHNGTAFTGSDVGWTGLPSAWGRTQISAAPGLAAVAAIGNYGIGHWTVDTAVKVLDYAPSYQNPNGSFGFDGGPHTDFVVADMAEAVLLLRGRVPQAKIDAWTATLVAGSEYLWTVEQGWYTNGNIEILSTHAFEMTRLVTGAAVWAARRDAQYDWTIAPTQSGSGLGQGLITVVAPTLADGSDGKAYLAEKSGTAPAGYDPAYTQLSLTQATRWWQFSADPRALRLINLLHNQLMDRVDSSTWILDATNGSRLSTTDPWWNATTPALVWGGLRPDIPADRPASVWARINANFRQGRLAPGEALFRALSNNLTGWLREAGALGTGLP